MWWYDSDVFSTKENYFLCRGITVAITTNGLTRLELKKEQLPSFPFYLTLKSPAVSQRMSNSPSDKKRLSGFTVSWFLEDRNGTHLTEKLPPRAEDWNPMNQFQITESPFWLTWTNWQDSLECRI